MKYYLYCQNNSGGTFDVNRNVAEYVVIEAVDEADANEIALSIGIYFDGVYLEVDCECCGDRWCPPSEYKTLEEVEAYTKGGIWYGVIKEKQVRYHHKKKLVHVNFDEELFDIE